jgi:hypothetical protein
MGHAAFYDTQRCYLSAEGCEVVLSHALNRLIQTLLPEGLVLVGRQSQFADHFFVEMIPE